MSLRSRLFLGIGATVIVSLVVTVTAGALLTRRSLEDSAVRALARQVDLIAAGRQDAPEQSADAALGRFLATDQQRLAILTPEQAALLLPDAGAERIRTGLPASGSVDVRGERFLYAARSTGTEAIVLLRPADRQAADWWPFVVGLALAGIVGAALAAEPRAAPRRGAAGGRPSRGLVQRPVCRARAFAGRGARVPALGQPRAQDPADVDPRPRRRRS